MVRNLTPGFDQDMGFQYIGIPGGRWNTVPWMTWAPSGDRLAYIARFGKSKGTVITEHRHEEGRPADQITTVNEPESPCYSPDGKSIVFSALQNAKSDIFMVTWPPAGDQPDAGSRSTTTAPSSRRTASRSCIWRGSAGTRSCSASIWSTGSETQITFGTHDDTAARFLDADTIVFASTAVDPAQAIDPEVARNANIYNIWTLGLKTGELKQYTDSLGGNLAPVVLRESKNVRVAFMTYYKGGYGLHTIELTKPLKAVATADFGSPGPIIDFQAPLTHTLVSENVRRRSGSRRCTWRADRASRPASPTAATSSAAPTSA